MRNTSITPAPITSKAALRPAPYSPSATVAMCTLAPTSSSIPNSRPSSRTEAPRSHHASNRTGRRIFVEEREAAVTDELDDPPAVTLDACCGNGVEAVDELCERSGFERSDRTGESREIGDQDHPTCFATAAAPDRYRQACGAPPRLLTFCYCGGDSRRSLIGYHDHRTARVGLPGPGESSPRRGDNSDPVFRFAVAGRSEEERALRNPM